MLSNQKHIALYLTHIYIQNHIKTLLNIRKKLLKSKQRLHIAVRSVHGEIRAPLS
jgi:hypothetical protein